MISFVVIDPPSCGRDGSGLSARVWHESECVNREKERKERLVHVSMDVVDVEVESGDRSSKMPDCTGINLGSRQKDGTRKGSASIVEEKISPSSSASWGSMVSLARSDEQETFSAR